MASNRVRIHGPRDVRATVDSAASDDGSIVAMCPPHPRHGGTRHDPRLRAVSRRLCEARTDCLRVDYGPWDGGRGEREDARRAVDWAAQHGYERIGLFGYSFGGGIAILAAAADRSIDALVALAPVARVGDESVARAFETVDVPALVVVGSDDGTVDWRSVVAAAPPTARVETIPADHGFAGRFDRIGSVVGDFFEGTLADRP